MASASRSNASTAVSDLTHTNTDMGLIEAALTTVNPSNTYSVSSANFNLGTSAIGSTFNANTSTYFGFTVTPTSGTAAHLTDFNLGISSRTNVLTGATTYSIRSNANEDNFRTEICGAATVPVITTWSLKTHSCQPVDGAIVAPVDFRLYAFGGTGLANINKLMYGIR